jgi:alpha-glucosidase
MIRIPGLTLALAAALAAPTLTAADRTGCREGHPWWKHAVIYELYPRSFQDSDGDGTGDLKGITSRLDYLERLGIDAIWITPCFPSPQKDFGYDVSDYCNIDPRYGTLADFDELVAQARKRGIRVVLDFVINHTSDQHPWFLASKASRTDPHHDWYVWRDGREGGAKPPCNWLSSFGGSAWTREPATGQWYYHYFLAGQPDLNWRNPEVEKAMFDATRFWYRRGVAGFRLDAVDCLFEDPALRDNPLQEGVNEFGDPNMDNKYNDKAPENHQVLKRLRKVADSFDAVLIGETWTSNIAELKEYYGSARDEIQLPMDFLFTSVGKLSAPAFRQQIRFVEESGEWPTYVLSNHDIVRSYTRYADGFHDEAIAKLMATLLLTLRGTPILYYGEELGLPNHDPERKEDVQDPLGRAGWPQNKGRDGERAPMPWDATPSAGFTTGKPWLPLPITYRSRNVTLENRAPESVLNHYRKLIALRHAHEALKDGRLVLLDGQNPDILAYLRREGDETILVALNFGKHAQIFRADLAAPELKGARAESLLGKGPADPASLSLEPFGVQVLQITH